jgi:hypothetical protein
VLQLSDVVGLPPYIVYDAHPVTKPTLGSVVARLQYAIDSTHNTFERIILCPLMRYISLITSMNTVHLKIPYVC